MISIEWFHGAVVLNADQLRSYESQALAFSANHHPM
jgi:hypothetical protein